MTPAEFTRRLLLYCTIERASVTSWFRTSAHNAKVGGVAGSAHRFGLAADVVYDLASPPADGPAVAEKLGLMLLREKDHDHLQPKGWKKG